MKGKHAILGILALLQLQLVAAQMAAQGRGITTTFRNIITLLNNEYFVYFLNFVFFFMLFYSIYASAASKIRVFGEGGGLSRQGKVFSVALSAITVLAFFWFTRGMGIRQMLTETFGAFGTLGGIFFAIITFLLMYRGFAEDLGHGNALLAAFFTAGLALIIAGTLFKQDMMVDWGWMIVIITAIIGIITLITSFWRGRRAGAEGRAERARAEGEGAEGGEPGAGDERARRRPGRVSIHSIIPYNRAVLIRWWRRPEEEVMDYEARYFAPLEPRVAGKKRGLGLGHEDPHDPNLRFAVIDGLANLRMGRKYRFQIRAINRFGKKGPWSRMVKAAPSATYPAPPAIPPTEEERGEFPRRPGRRPFRIHVTPIQETDGTITFHYVIEEE